MTKTGPAKGEASIVPRNRDKVPSLPNRLRNAVAPQGHCQPGREQSGLLDQPPAALFDFGRIGFLVEPALAVRLVLEMLDRVGDVDGGAVHSRSGEGAVEDGARGPDKGPSR